MNEQIGFQVVVSIWKNTAEFMGQNSKVYVGLEWGDVWMG